jgi:DNA-binding CsgD family transcriptional regulator
VQAVVERDDTMFAKADRILESFPWWRHVARRLVSESAIENGWGHPAEWLRESLSFFEEGGHDRTVQACRALLRRAGAPVPRKGRGESRVPERLGRRGVTSREMDVLRLVGQGIGNRQIGERLFLSPRTVETHVASLMRKLDVSTRADLAAMILTEASAGVTRKGS